MRERLPEFIADLHRRGVVDATYTEYQPLSGGTASVVAKLWAAGDECADKPVYVIKANTPALNREEAHFLDVYRGIGWFPELKDLAPDHRFLLYLYQSGEIGVRGEAKRQALIDLVENVINRYQLVEATDGFGYQDEPMANWQAFLVAGTERSQTVIGEHVAEEDHQLVRELAALPHRLTRGQGAFLLHGDCGVHNFLMKDGRLCGVIDATPVVGPPIYDLLYAFCSSPDELTEEVLYDVVARLTNWQEPAPGALVEEVLIRLYARIRTCLRVHPDDLSGYLEAWQYWKAIYLANPHEKLVRK